MVPANKTILILERKKKSAGGVKEVLEKDGYHLLTADDFKEGMEMFIRKRVDLVFAGSGMSQIGGDYLAFFIKERAPDVPVILITEPGEILPTENFEKEYFDAHISKPFRPEAVNRIIRRYMH